MSAVRGTTGTQTYPDNQTGYFQGRRPELGVERSNMKTTEVRA